MHYDGIAYEYGGYDYLTGADCIDLRKTHKSDVKDGWRELVKCGFRARYKSMGNGTYVLRSYETDVLAFDPSTKSVKRMWEGYSKTTMKHVDVFCATLNIRANISSKRAWSNLPVGEWRRL